MNIKPKTIQTTINSILLSWKNVFNSSNIAVYNVQIQTDFGNWKTVYWGSKSQCLVDALAPCNIYNFRIKSLDWDWLYFKSATACIPYFMMHMTRAVKFGDTSMIRKIIMKRFVLLETRNKGDKTPLIQAVEDGNLPMVTFLLNIGANINNTTLITDRTPLMVALFRNNLKIAKHLIKKGANQQAVDCNCLTALHYAVDSDLTDNVKFCLNYNFNINAIDNKGWTPLLRAVILNCNDNIVKILLENDADPSIKDRNGFDFYNHMILNNRVEDITKFLHNSKMQFNFF
ncbi:hypothetical protein FQA39_LY08642 [Lamprigera yunnana]|nr:hypothetical protein FQA39_LY08642 [Lamprigera yunnana]